MLPLDKEAFMTKQVFASDLPYPFSAAVRTGNLLFVSGQVGIRSGKTGDGIEEQTRFTLDNIRDVLERAGSSLDRVVKVTVFITDMSQWPKMNEVYREYFPVDPPARSALGANGLALPELLVEMEAVAEVG
jgi:2-iminobutanoate/2-iminopropanoate deaminase